MFCELIWHILTIVICQWYVLSLGSTKCVLSCFPVDGLSLNQTSKLLRYFSVYVELKCSYMSNSNCSYTSNSTVLIRRTQTVLIHRTQSVLIRRTETVFLYVKLKVFYSTLQRVYSTPSVGPSILHTGFVKSPVSGTFLNAYYVKSSVILCSALCSRTSLYPVWRVYTTL